MRAAPITVAVTAILSGAATLAVAVLPQLSLVYDWPNAHLELETAGSLIALLASVLVFGRLRRRTRLNELMLACGLAALALADLFFVTVPPLSDQVPQDPTGWAALVGRSLGTVLFALAALVPRRPLQRRGLVLAAGAAGIPAALVLTALCVRSFGGGLPPGLAIPAKLPPGFAGRPDLRVAPALLALQLGLVVLYGLAAMGFLRRSRRLGDEFFVWLAIAAVLAATAQLNYFLYPSLRSSLFYTGDVFRALSYALLLIGSMREISSSWHALSAVAALEERRRIARDLHDGLAQELAYLSRNLDSLNGAADREQLGRLRRAVARAQLESRRAVTTLAALQQTVEITVAQAAREIAEQYHVELELNLAPGILLPSARVEALIRIACEAVTNAARHSGADRVSLSLERDGQRVRMRVSDNGCGFDTAAAVSGFGLISMRERAQSVGGEIRVRAAPGRGSDVELAL